MSIAYAFLARVYKLTKRYLIQFLSHCDAGCNNKQATTKKATPAHIAHTFSHNDDDDSRVSLSCETTTQRSVYE